MVLTTTDLCLILNELSLPPQKPGKNLARNRAERYKNVLWTFLSKSQVPGVVPVDNFSEGTRRPQRFEIESEKAGKMARFKVVSSRKTLKESHRNYINEELVLNYERI
jgi:hypothetical protein